MTQRRYRPIALTLAALSLAALAAGCSAAQKETARQLCQQHPADCADLLKDVAKVPPGGTAPAQGQAQVAAQPVDAGQVPDGFRGWNSGSTGAPEPGFKVVAGADGIYLGISGGLRPTGGYTVRLVGDLRREADGWVADAEVLRPAPDRMVTQMVTTPVAYYKLPKLDGSIQVRFAATSSGPTPAAPTPAPVGSAGSGSGTTAPRPVPAGGGSIAKDQVWSQNFRATRPRLLADGRLFLEGTARAFEAVFRVEVWAGGKLLLSQSVQAAAGAPEFGRFEVTLTVPGGVPAGAEVRYQIPSMKDGSATTELTLPVQ